MTVFRMKIIPRAIQVSRHKRSKVCAVLAIDAFAHFIPAIFASVRFVNWVQADRLASTLLLWVADILEDKCRNSLKIKVVSHQPARR